MASELDGGARTEAAGGVTATIKAESRGAPLWPLQVTLPVRGDREPSEEALDTYSIQ
jgi:hypothetical protein